MSVVASIVLCVYFSGVRASSFVVTRSCRLRFLQWRVPMERMILETAIAALAKAMPPMRRASSSLVSFHGHEFG